MLDKTQPAIARATAVSLLRRGDVIGDALKDESALVRGTAASRAASLLPEPLLVSRVKPLLTDEYRWVRTEAAQALAGVASVRNDEAFLVALGEYLARQGTISDRPEAHLNLGALSERFGRPDRAETAYRTAIRVDPAFLPARFNLAVLYNSGGRNEDAEKVLVELIRRAPKNGEARYSYALLLAEMRRFNEALAQFEEAIRLMPDFRRVRYNYALTLQTIGRTDDARRELQRLAALEPDNPEYVRALAGLR